MRIFIDWTFGRLSLPHLSFLSVRALEGISNVRHVHWTDLDTAGFNRGLLFRPFVLCCSCRKPSPIRREIGVCVSRWIIARRAYAPRTVVNNCAASGHHLVLLATAGTTITAATATTPWCWRWRWWCVAADTVLLVLLLVCYIYTCGDQQHHQQGGGGGRGVLLL